MFACTFTCMNVSTWMHAVDHASTYVCSLLVARSYNGYVCLAVMHAAGEGCRGSVSVEATRDVRLISSDFKLHGYVASVRCPVDIHAASGQRINITLHNFGQPSRRHRERGRCPHHLVIADGQDRRNVSLCGRRRVSQAYISRSSRIEMYFAVADHADVSSQFLVSFDGRISVVVITTKN